MGLSIYINTSSSEGSARLEVGTSEVVERTSFSPRSSHLLQLTSLDSANLYQLQYLMVIDLFFSCDCPMNFSFFSHAAWPGPETSGRNFFTDETDKLLDQGRRLKKFRA
ncbi:unnamed protein product [Durusdinium trenchii]|uniref:Uncharacterized protein n=1 Tax=Durusdinium trenchii TaxID=1381693 RepID=A0ABP0SCB9_9DINO